LKYLFPVTVTVIYFDVDKILLMLILIFDMAIAGIDIEKITAVFVSSPHQRSWYGVFDLPASFLIE